MKQQATHNLPCAAIGLTSYRYKGRYGYVMIGAKSDEEALREAARSIDGPPSPLNLEVWSSTKAGYVGLGRS